MHRYTLEIFAVLKNISLNNKIKHKILNCTYSLGYYITEIYEIQEFCEDIKKNIGVSVKNFLEGVQN